jgi:excisionase family DNA binding protein
MKGFLYEDYKYFLTVKETAYVLNVSVDTVYRLIETEKIAAVRVSPRKTVIKVEELERYINSN